MNVPICFDYKPCQMGVNVNEDTTTILNPYSCFQGTWNCFSYFEKFDNSV